MTIIKSNIKLFKEGIFTKRFLAGSDVIKELGLEYAPTDWRLAVETVRSPAAKHVTTNAAVAKMESTSDIVGTVSAKD